MAPSTCESPFGHRALAISVGLLLCSHGCVCSMRRALIEGYSYCPYCGGGLNPPWACCGSTVASYYPRLRQAREQGWINRTVFCFGWMLAKSQWNPGGWTHESLRAEATNEIGSPGVRGVFDYTRSIRAASGNSGDGRRTGSATAR